jgi:hypothetical protein
MVTLEVLVNLRDFKSRPGSGSSRELAFEPKASAPEPSPRTKPQFGTTVFAKIQNLSLPPPWEKRNSQCHPKVNALRPMLRRVPRLKNPRKKTESAQPNQPSNHGSSPPPRQTLNSSTKSETKKRDQRPETRDQRPETRDQRPETRDQRPETRDQRPECGVSLSEPGKTGKALTGMAAGKPDKNPQVPTSFRPSDLRLLHFNFQLSTFSFFFRPPCPAI